MAESYYDRNRKPRRRREHGDYGKRGSDVSPTPSKPPLTILGLAKPLKREDNTSIGSIDQENDATSVSESAFLSKGVSEISLSEKHTDHDSNVGYVSVHGESGDHLDVKSQNQNSGESTSLTQKRTLSASNSSGATDQSANAQLKLIPPLEKLTRVKLVDDSFQWCDAGLELLLEQSDFLVIGVVGSQGSGKSTILSFLAGNSHRDSYKNYIFTPQTRETKEDSQAQTCGIDMFINPERVILLDTQPLLSSSVMDHLIRIDRKLPSDYSSLQTFVEMQSMQILTFLMSVCHVLIIAEEWFSDVNLLRFVQDAEMLKPATQAPPSSQTSETSAKEESTEFYPTVIFVQNKSSREHFDPETYSQMQLVLHNIFQSSKLKYSSGINMTNNSNGDSIVVPPPNSETAIHKDVNLLLIPTMEFYKNEADNLHHNLPEYRGYPSFNTILCYLRSQIFSSPRTQFTHNTLSEKNWFHFAARMWEAVKKSPLLSEYNRLLSSSF